MLTFLFTGVSCNRELPKPSCSSNPHEILHFQRTRGLELVLHHPQSLCSPIAGAGNFTLTTALLHDSSHVESIEGRLTSGNSPKKRRGPAEELFGQRPNSNSHLPLTPGGAVATFFYVTELGLGTPAVDYVMVVHTGSSLTWVQCEPCEVSCHPQSGPVFNPGRSATYKKIPCSAAACTGLRSATLNPPGCTASGVCVYQATYGENTAFSIGYVSEDTLSFAGREVLPRFVYGCGQDNKGFVLGQSAGLMGLARHNLSLVSQLAAPSFSYCLPSETGTGAGALSFGDYNPSAFSFTPMLHSPLDDSLYFLRLADIVVDKRSLPVEATLYGSLPTIIDTGTILTRLPTPVYSALSKAVAAAMAGHKKVPGFDILEDCYQGTMKGKGMVRVPEVRLVFQGGAAMELRPENVMVDVGDNTTCLVFAPAEKVAVIGNWQQQGFSVVYDVAHAKIGFAAGGC